MIWQKKHYYLIMMVILVAFAGCSAVNEPLLPTLRPTFTATSEPSATFTAVFVPTKTPTRPPIRIVITRTAGASPTPILGKAPTENFLPVSPTPINYAPGALEIEYFTTSTTSIKPGERFTLFWSARGVDKATIYRLDATGKRGQVWNVGRAGSLDVASEPTDTSDLKFMIMIGNAASSLDQTITIPLIIGCTESWFFDPPPLECATTAPLYSIQVSQNFERGVMIWVREQARIYVLFNDGNQPAWTFFSDDFRDGQPESDNAFVPPAGLSQPIRGFGLIWRRETTVRDRLGWATTGESPFNGAIQGDATVSGGVMYMNGLNNVVYQLVSLGTSWKLVTP